MVKDISLIGGKSMVKEKINLKRIVILLVGIIRLNI